MGEITISTEEYRKLVEEKAAADARISAFAGYMEREKYSIGREMCAAILGLELKGTEGGVTALGDRPQ